MDVPQCTKREKDYLLTLKMEQGALLQYQIHFGQKKVSLTQTWKRAVQQNSEN